MTKDNDILLEETEPRTIILLGEINAENVMRTILKIQKLDSINHDPIILEINSPGGSVDDGLALIDVMEYVESPIHTIAFGQASSMASLILAAGEKGYRQANKHCKILLHQLQVGYNGKFNDIEEGYKSMMKLNDTIYNLYSKYTEHDVKDIKDKLQNDFILNGVEALEYGIIDGTI